MKRFLIIFFAIFTSIIYSQNSSPEFLVIDSSYTTSPEKPILLLTGQKVRILADSLYLVNKPRLSFYEDLRDQLLNLNYDCEPTLALFRESMLQNSKLADQLYRNSESEKSLNTSLLSETRILLEKNKNMIQNALTDLEEAQINLDNAKDEIFKIKTNTVLENILYGFAGIGIGILVGITID